MGSEQLEVAAERIDPGDANLKENPDATSLERLADANGELQFAGVRYLGRGR